jgi:hypothetical protein
MIYLQQHSAQILVVWALIVMVCAAVLTVRSLIIDWMRR